MTTFGFVRHGVTAWNKEKRAQGSSDIPLDEEGIEMAERVAERLSSEQWDIVYTSPQLRAKQTAEMIAERLPNLPFHTDFRLREVGGGLIEGTTEAERIAKWGEAWRELDLGTEPYEEVIARGADFLEEMKEKYPGKRILVISHGGFIWRLLGVLIPEREFEKNLQNTSVTVVEVQEDVNLCHLFNCTKHLDSSF
ncbi:histidine phosphatase family protein [Sporosarcina sp. ACRSM]|uniref:histidine phosphatase family protein n=1 Tax=Sporosarcina sp. ACRSM TaxID=2918216 RepID=UPI001EF4F5D9|nr:histidine phosphatase family protein [Sporosarcina sp. ACRSM]MCG7335942.1 histidine phosphatase family protein [Sporosarcina sp. ACRSM]